MNGYDGGSQAADGVRRERLSCKIAKRGRKVCVCVCGGGGVVMRTYRSEGGCRCQTLPVGDDPQTNSRREPIFKYARSDQTASFAPSGVETLSYALMVVCFSLACAPPQRFFPSSQICSWVSLMNGPR